MNRPPLLPLAHCTVFRYYIALCDCIDVCCERHCVPYKTSRVLLLAAVAVVGVLAATATAATAATAAVAAVAAVLAIAIAIAIAVAVAVAVAYAVCFPGPHTAAARPADTTRRAARRDARRFCKGQGCPLQKFLPALRTWSAQRGRREDGVCFFGYFLCTSKESDSRPQGRESLASLYSTQPQANPQPTTHNKPTIARRRTLIRPPGTFSRREKENPGPGADDITPPQPPPRATPDTPPPTPAHPRPRTTTSTPATPRNAPRCRATATATGSRASCRWPSSPAA